MLRRIEERAANSLGRIGERLRVDALVYNPLRMHLFHLDSMPYAAPFAHSVAKTFPSARTVADIGCGSGAYAAAFDKAGITAIACERSRLGRALARAQGVDCRPFDLTQRPPAKRMPDVDLAYCVEVAEHLTPELGERLVEFLCSIAPVTVFTAAPPGQGGTGHINEQPMTYWEERFKLHDRLIDEPRTSALGHELRATAENVDVLVRNIRVFASAPH